MSNLLFEHMIRVEAGGLVCRIWRQMDGVDRAGANYNLKQRAQDLMTGNYSPKDVAAQLVEAEGVNSVEVVFKLTGDGICVHKDWP